MKSVLINYRRFVDPSVLACKRHAVQSMADAVHDTEGGPRTLGGWLCDVRETFAVSNHQFLITSCGGDGSHY
jgi:hypothetical protein